MAGRNRKAGKRYPSGQLKGQTPMGPTKEILERRGEVVGKEHAKIWDGSSIHAWYLQDRITLQEYQNALWFWGLQRRFRAVTECPCDAKAISFAPNTGTSVVRSNEECERIEKAYFDVRAKLGCVAFGMLQAFVDGIWSTQGLRAVGKLTLGATKK